MHNEAVDREWEELILGGTKVVVEGEVKSDLTSLFDMNESVEIEDFIATVSHFDKTKLE